MKIILTAPAFFPHSFGGGEIYVYRLAKELLRRNHKVNILTPVKWDADKKSHEVYALKNYSYENIPVLSISLNPDKISFAEKATGHGPVLIKLLRKVIGEYSPELIYINGMKPTLVSLCNELRVPHVVTAHHTGIVCSAGGLIRYDSTVCKEEINADNCIPCCCIWKRPKWYVGSLMGRIPGWIYGPLGKRLHARNKLPYFLRGLITPWIIEESMRQKKIVMEKAQLTIAPSYFMKDLLVKGGCNPDKIRVIPHGIEPIGRIPIENIKGRPIRLGYIGRIDPSKGLHLLLEATEFLRNGSSCEIHIFGAARNPWDEEYREKTLRAYKGNLKIIDHGLISYNKLSDIYANIDVLVVPSILPEAFGLVVAEAFSAGRPVIVFNSGALPEQVRDGVNGFVVKDNNSKSLSMEMQKFIDNPNLITEMSKNIPHVKTIQEYVDEVEKIYSIIRHDNSHPKQITK
jgi:glycosyltransferase involved in cell wall biosynthesis